MKWDRANLISGDLDFEMEGDLKNGYWITPMVLEGIKFDSMSYHQEKFGPIFELYKVKDKEEALRYANRSNYGHGLTIFSENPKSCKFLAYKSRVGIVSVN